MVPSENSVRESIEQIGRTLRVHSWTVACAESVTGGRIQAPLTSISGASDFFQGGITTYNLAQKVEHLGVSSRVAEASNCVCPQVCDEMATGACRMFRATVAIATTGYAEPERQRGVVQPFALAAIAYWFERETEPPRVVWRDRLSASGPREHVQQQIAVQAVQKLAELLDRQPPLTTGD